MRRDELKKIVSLEALKYIKSGDVIGVGTGSTISYFISLLDLVKGKIKGAISSSKISSIKLRKVGVPLLDLNNVNSLEVYIDSADEIDQDMQMIKGGGAALTREKIISFFAKKFICIVDESKQVKMLGKFPLPIEVIPMARSVVSTELVRLGGNPVYRENVITDNGNIIIDVHNLNIINAMDLEVFLNNIPGIVTVGLFSCRKADIVLISGENGIKTVNVTKF
ncbi:Ribose-5-phosphate isomerase A [Candidatus Westeberhardia cardiocondylae]|uniref:Ribose-5-phosphate isomerase A n=1 Tax=Candidatus Westeberhardia cardiocondylae TaxID=1594731 RepID=A0A0H5C5R2_9ENTR|nr:ribose-5-phosphate isomerase RpiA [Candidatus Westeberhardia cardiocondylae]MCR3756323.1 ribose-5-phosphate isomerase A [Candidatus Westeberhardia cardiocondylae]CEN32301.1 Ribose-5-phosphate isomerase A [Candidatus Westeberhardia cardiocondylae]